MEIDRERLQLIEGIAGERVRAGNIPCAVVAVANSRETLWTHVVPGDEGVGLDSIFLLASITKPIAATAIMRLVEEGRLMLNVPVAHYLPEFGANGKEKVTAFHLLTHSSGMEEETFWNELWGAPMTLPPPNWQYEACCRSYLHYEPGTQHTYSTLTFSVLAELVRKLGGAPQAEYLRRHIFEPLGMHDTGYRPTDPTRAAPVHKLIGDAETTPELLEAFMSFEQPGSGLWSTAADLVTLGQAYLRGGTYEGYHLLSPVTIEVMTRNYTPGATNTTDGEPFNYGLGWGKPMYPPNAAILGSQRAYSHHGATGTMLRIDPEYDLVVAFLTNTWGHQDPTDAKGRILNVVYGAMEY
ncbi:MAG TPA: serine hydrolase domain-containing protein [Chloroflexia bacterium]|nr:serine hydrolase domain-containing protein [Chloroflexia bacterium]